MKLLFLLLVAVGLWAQQGAYVTGISAGATVGSISAGGSAGTAGCLPKFEAATTLINSIACEAANVLTVLGTTATTLVAKAGSAQSTTKILDVQNSAGTSHFAVAGDSGSMNIDGSFRLRVLADAASSTRGIEMMPAIFSGAQYIRAYANTTGTFDVQAYNTGDSAVKASIIYDNYTGGAGGSLQFRTALSGVGVVATEKMRINLDGAVNVYNQLATTGVSRLWIREGAGQAGAESFGVYATDGTTYRLKLLGGDLTIGGRLQLGGTTSSFGALSRDGAGLRVTTADSDTAYSDISMRHSLAGGPAPTLGGACSTAASGTLTDESGKITTTTTGTCTFTITFGTAYTTDAPSCSVFNETTANLARPTSTVSVLTGVVTTISGDVLSYSCRGHKP